MALSGSVSTNAWTSSSSGNTWRVVLNWTATQNVENNISTISWNLKVSTASSQYVIISELRVTIGGTQVYYRDASNHTKGYNNTTLASGSTTVTHNNDGSKSLAMTVEAGIYDWAINKSGSDTFTLNTIPRAASLTSAPDFNDEQNPTISYLNSAGNSVSSLQACISLTGQYDDVQYRDIPKTGSSYTFSLTESERNVLRNACTTANSRTVYFFVRTIIGSTTYHSTLKRTLTIVNATPVFGTLSYYDNSPTANITQNNQMIVWGKSNLIAKYTAATAYKGASISKYRITLYDTIKESTAPGGTINFGFITSQNNLTLSAVAIDSRGNSSNTVSITVYCYAYSPPYFTAFNAYRANSNGIADSNGSYIKCTYGVSYSSVNNTNSPTVNITGGPDVVAATGGSALINLNGNTTNTYTIHASVTDKYGGISYSNAVVVFGATRAMNITSDGTGFAIGKMAESNNLFECRWDAKFNGDVTIDGKTLLDWTHPVGSIYQSINATSPEELFGGTWEQLSGRFLIAADDTYIAGSTGGEATHTLTVDEIPSHEGHLDTNETNWNGNNNLYLPSTVFSSYGTTPRGWATQATNEVVPAGESKGGGQAHNNMPPYLAVYMWKRTA